MSLPVADLELRASVARLDESYHVVTLAGELDLHNAATLHGLLEPLVAAGSGSTIVDLHDVDFLDSTALGVLTGAATRLRARGDELVLATDDPRLRRLLQVTGLLRVLAHERTLADAVERVGGHSLAHDSREV